MSKRKNFAAPDPHQDKHEHRSQAHEQKSNDHIHRDPHTFERAFSDHHHICICVRRGFRIGHRFAAASLGFVVRLLLHPLGDTRGSLDDHLTCHAYVMDEGRCDVAD